MDQLSKFQFNQTVNESKNLIFPKLRRPEKYTLVKICKPTSGNSL